MCNPSGRALWQVLHAPKAASGRYGTLCCHFMCSICRDCSPSQGQPKFHDNVRIRIIPRTRATRLSGRAWNGSLAHRIDGGPRVLMTGIVMGVVIFEAERTDRRDLRDVFT